MQNILAEGNGKGDGYAMFIGRWQPWHKGHRWLIDQQLNQGKKVLLCVRDVHQDEKNPWSAWQVMMNLSEELMDLIEDNKVRVMIIPNIESINFGRGVGYDVIEHIPPADIHEISATKIREQMKQDGKDIL
jgi:nicotinamide mononucleotide adenylyltransferase